MLGLIVVGVVLIGMVGGGVGGVIFSVVVLCGISIVLCLVGVSVVNLCWYFFLVSVLIWLSVVMIVLW